MKVSKLQCTMVFLRVQLFFGVHYCLTLWCKLQKNNIAKLIIIQENFKDITEFQRHLRHCCVLDLVQYHMY